MKVRNFSRLRDAYADWRSRLAQARQTQSLTVAVAEGILNDYFLPEPNGDLQPLSGRFDETKYPDLVETLKVLPNAAAFPDKQLLKDWGKSWDELNAGLAKSALARFLLAFIWKRGELPLIHYVLDGLRSHPGNVPEGGAVLYQFGRFLADPAQQPICDKHSYRAYFLLLHFDEWEEEGGLEKLEPPPVKIQEVADYSAWWKENVLASLAKGEEAWRIALAVDRVMFSLGKAASPLSEEKDT